MKLKDLADRLKADLSGPGDMEITGVAGIAEALPGDITFLADPKRIKDLERTKASAVIVPRGVEGLAPATLTVRNPRLAFARALEVFYVKQAVPAGVSDRAVIGKNVTLGKDPTVHAGAVVGDDARIGDRVVLHPGVVIGTGVVIGDDCILYANVSIREGVRIGNRVILHAGAAIGGDGFGFVTDEGRHHKIPQVGGVIIEDDVEIGSNSCVDKATLGNTVIKQGTKIDNLVQVAHNVTIGEHSLLASQVGIAGSTTLGRYVVMGGQAGAGDHLTIGDQVMAGGRAAINSNIEPGKIVAGHYAMPLRDWLKIQAVLPKLPEMRRQIAALERRLADLTKDATTSPEESQKGNES
ncbi:MAG: UDP-3-O-(3-hydroxymyristoyl)glucosamine N-acyltransferase [Nitrospiraceae bacterium]|nr:UDP-3-O-(3-hydroxymyristoyl)glucosamine N-acyltransferase [Nitrospiraceae bacterium]